VNRPDPKEYNAYYGRYISLVPDGDIVQTLESQWPETKALLCTTQDERGEYRYADGKWSIKEVLGHLIDSERIFAYRALRIARGDATPLPGFEQDDYVKTANSDARSLASLIDEFSAVRRANVLMLQNFDPEAWTRMGTASNNPVSVRALAWIIAGHELHHRSVLKEKYL
jgi:uncharacterized damage-inducible protein DinB